MNTNELLLEFADRFRLDGDLLRCVECNRGIVASRMEEDFVHAAGCKLRTIGGRPWTLLQAILCGPLVDTIARLQAERDTTEAALRVWCADLSKFVAESTDQIVATMTRFEIEDLKEAGLWREPNGGES